MVTDFRVSSANPKVLRFSRRTDRKG